MVVATSANLGRKGEEERREINEDDSPRSRMIL